MKGAVAKLGAAGNPATVAAAVEFVLEGLHLNRKLNKERGESRSTFRA
jgi:magnesium chelatase subunit I